LRIRYSDHTSHNVHPLPRLNKEFDIMQPRKGMEYTATFDKPELMIPLGCAAHPWMEAHISVMAHPSSSSPEGTDVTRSRGFPACILLSWSVCRGGQTEGNALWLHLLSLGIFPLLLLAWGNFSAHEYAKEDRFCGPPDDEALHGRHSR
jgi:hypothetical protein